MTRSAPPTGPLKSDVWLLCLGVLCGSAGGPLAAVVVVASGFAVAFWRLLAGTIFALPLGLSRVKEITGAGRKTVLLSMSAGCLLAGHFVAFMTSVGLTSVASATALINSQIVWAAVISRLTGQHISRRAWWGVGISVAGVALITGVDFQLSAEAVTGDFIALAGGVLGGAYIVTGSHVRRTLSSPTYTLLCYGSGTLLLLPICLISGQQLLGLPLNDWLAILALTLFAQLIGQNVFNHVLRSIPPTLVSLGMLFTAPLSAALAWIFLDQVPPISAAIGLVVLVLGAALVISGSLGPPAERTYRPPDDDADGRTGGG